MAKPQDLFDEIKYRFFDESKNTISDPISESNKIWSQLDHLHLGRCFTFKATAKMISNGIKSVHLRILKPSRIFIHTNGMFKSTKEKARISVGLSRKVVVNLDHEVYNMLDFGGQSCSTDPDFDVDLCTDAKFEREALEKFGCTSPFGPKKDKICQDKKNGSNVMQLYKKIYQGKRHHTCKPCSFLTSKAIVTKDVQIKMKNDISELNIHCKENVKVFEAHYLYDGLTLIAEIGGYVGLFLGISVNQVSVLMNTLLKKFDGVFN